MLSAVTPLIALSFSVANSSFFLVLSFFFVGFGWKWTSAILCFQWYINSTSMSVSSASTTTSVPCSANWKCTCNYQRVCISSTNVNNMPSTFPVFASLTRWSGFCFCHWIGNIPDHDVRSSFQKAEYQHRFCFISVGVPGLLLTDLHTHQTRYSTFCNLKL